MNTSLNDFGIEGGASQRKQVRVDREKQQLAIQNEKTILLRYSREAIAIKLKKWKKSFYFRFIFDKMVIQPSFGMVYAEFEDLYPEVVSVLQGRGFDPANPEQQLLDEIEEAR